MHKKWNQHTYWEKSRKNSAPYLSFGSSQIANKHMCIDQSQSIPAAVGSYWTFQNYLSSDESVREALGTEENKDTWMRFHYFCFLWNNLINDLFHFQDVFTVFFAVFFASDEYLCAMTYAQECSYCCCLYWKRKVVRCFLAASRSCSYSCRLPYAKKAWFSTRN